MPHPSGHVPIDGPNVVTGLVFAHFLEGDARSFEDASVVPAEQVLDGSPSADLQSPDLSFQIRGSMVEMFYERGAERHTTASRVA